MSTSRVHQVEEARRQYGDLVDRLLPFLHQSDTIADETVAVLAELPKAEGWGLIAQALEHGVGAIPHAPETIHRFFAAVEHVPLWVDWKRIERAGQLLFRAGVFGRTVLGAKSLVHGYCAPAGNKPLVFSGRLQNKPMRRLLETARFVQAVCSPGGMRRSGDGFAITVKVRLMHAQVRRLLWRSGVWREDLWARPINQHDMLATALLFSSVWMDGVRRFGLHIDPQEAEDYMHLWRYVGYVIGVDPELLPTSEAEAIRLQYLIYLTQGPPDQDSRELVHALLEAPFQELKDRLGPARLQQRIAVSQAICRWLIDDHLADQLAIPHHPRIILMLRGIRHLIAQADGWRRRLPFASELSLRLEERLWERFVEQGLHGKPADFHHPDRLARS